MKEFLFVIHAGNYGLGDGAIIFAHCTPESDLENDGGCTLEYDQEWPGYKPLSKSWSRLGVLRLSDGAILAGEGHNKFPPWVLNPLLREMKLAELRSKQL